MRVDMFESMYHGKAKALLGTTATATETGAYWLAIEQDNSTITLHFHSHTSMVDFFDNIDNQLSGMLETPAEERRVSQSHSTPKSPSE